MNHIYKSIFNKALGVFTAVPEFASAHGKGSERTVVGRVAKGTAGFAASALAISVGLALTSTSAVAAPGIFINNGQDPACLAVIDDVATSALQLIYGGSKTIYPAVGVAAGSPLGTKTNFELDARNPCLSTGGTGAENHNTQTNRTLFYNNKNLTLGGRLDVNSGIIGVGDRGTDGVGATNSIRMGTGTTLDEANKKTNAISIGVDAGASADNAIAMGKSASAAGQRTIAMGENALAGNEASMALGYNSSAKGLAQVSIGQGAGTLKNTTDSGAADATFIGNYAGADSASPIGNLRGVAVGTNAGRNLVSGAHNIAVGYDAGKSIEGSNNVAIGYNAGSNVNGNLNFAGGREAGNSVKGEKNIALGYISGQNIEGNDNTTVGYSSGNNVTGWGNFAGASKAGQFVEGYNNVAIGYQAGMGTADNLLKTSGGVSISTNSKAKTSFSIAIGDSSSAGDNSTGAHGGGRLAIAIGQNANANFYHAIALGHSSRVSPATGQSAEDGIAIGSGALVDNYKGIAVGAYSRAKGRQSTVIANNVRDSNYSTASGDRSQVYGAETNVSGNNSVAIGDTNTVASARTYAIGNNINAAAGTDDSLAFGTKAGVGGPNAIALGNTAKASAANTVAISNQAQAKTPYSVALGASAVAGDDSTGALNGGEAAIAIGRQAVANVYNGIAIGKQATIKKDSDDGIAIGAETKVNAYKGAAIGAFSEANGSQALAIGNNKQGQSSVASGERSQVIGVESNVSGQDSTAIGYKNTVASARTYAMGNNINVAAGADDSLAFGTRAAVGAENTVAIGANANAAQANSVALGAGSATSDVHTGDYTLNTSYTAAGLPNAANGTVSVGSAGKERQIQNVAAGVISATSTDAINGSQLYATNNYLSNLAGGVKNVLGGDAAVDNAGNLTMSNIGGTGKGNVNDAIAAANTKVAAGENITVTPTTNADGSKTYTVATKKDLVVDSVKAGDTTVNTDGVTIANGPSVKKDGINAGDKKITGVADGNVAAGSKDAVNGGQLAEVKAKADSAVQDVVSSNPTALTANKVGNTVTLTPNFIAGDLVNADGTVKDPAAADEGKLVSAKTVADALKANHFVVDTKANGGTVDAASEENAKVGSGNKVTFEAGKNLVAQQTNTANGGATVNYKLSDTLENLVSVKSAEIEAGIGPNKVVLNNNGVKVGDSTLNDKGLTINNGPSVTDAGIDAGNKKITGVANGNVAAGSTDAVNGGQLAEVKSKADSAVQDVKSGDENALTAVKDPNTNIVTVTPKLSGDLVDANGNITAPTTPEEKGKLVTAGTVAEALANTHFVVDTKATDGELDAASQADQKIKASNKVTLQAGKNLKAKQTNGANGAEVEFSLKDSISLKEVKVGEGSANEVVLNNNGVNVAGNTYINKDGLNANDKKITNVAPGAVTAASKDAVNGSQLYNVANNVKDLIGPDAAIDPATGKVTVADPAKGIGETGKGNIGDAIKHVNDAAKAAAETAAKHTTVVEGKNVKVTKGKNAAGGDEYTVATKDDLDVTSVTAGNTTVNTNGLTITGGPSVTRGGIDAGNRVISGVKAGDVSATSQEAVNGSQLHATNTKLDGVKAKADTAVQDVKSGDENALTAVKDPNTNIVTVTPKLSGDLVDANGNITAPTTPADKGKLVTAGTVADALANTHFVVDTKATDGELDAASQADQKIKAGNKVTLQAGKNLKAKQTNGANGAQVEFSLKDSISLKEVTAGEGANQVVLGNDGVKVGDKTYINNDGLNANGKKITNVADGVDPTDAVNKGQLDAVKTVADSAVKSVDVANGEQNLVVDNTDPKNPKLSLKKDLTVDSVKAGDSTLNNDGLTIAGGPSVKKDGINAGDKTITNVAPGAVTPTSKDAVNGSQLYNVANNVKDLIGPDATIDPATGKVAVADPTKGIGETGKGTIGDAIKHVNDAAKAAADTAKKHSSVKAGDNIVVTEGTNAAGGKEYTVSTAKDLNVDSVKAGDTTVNNDGLTIAGGPSVKKDGIDAGDKNITNVADGVDAADAVNKGQLDKVAQNVVNVLGGNATVNGNGDITMSNIGDTGKGNVNDAIKAVNDLAKKAAAEKTSVKAKDGRSNVTVTEGVNAAGGHEYTVDVERSVTNAGSDYVTVTNNHDADSNTTTYTVDVSAKTKASLAKADSAVQGLTSKDGNLNFTKGANGNVEVSFNDNLNVKNVTTDRVQVANGPSMSKDGINAAGKAISNVANGNVAADSKDAVNGGQLYDTAKSVADVIGGGATVKDGKVVAGQNGIGNTGQNTVHGAIAAINQNTANNFNQIRGDLRKMDRDLRGGIAGALATAGLPQAFRPGKSMVAAAASTYRGQSGLAIGVSRISDNGKIILKVTGNTNSRGDFGGTIGAGYQW